jgi:hypothetical protein
MSKDFSTSQRWADEDGRIVVSDTKPHPDDLTVSESYRSPVRMFAVVMNMRRLAHSRRSASTQMQAR